MNGCRPFQPFGWKGKSIRLGVWEDAVASSRRVSCGYAHGDETERMERLESAIGRIEYSLADVSSWRRSLAGKQNGPEYKYGGEQEEQMKTMKEKK